MEKFSPPPIFGDRANLQILLVDDDPLVCSLGRELLEKMGYEVETASQGSEALDRCRRDPPVDLIILDYHLPDMNGLQLLRELKNTRPHTKVVMASGFFTSQELRQLQDDGASGFLSKPFRSRVIQALIKEVLAAPSGTSPGSPDGE